MPFFVLFSLHTAFNQHGSAALHVHLYYVATHMWGDRASECQDRKAQHFKASSSLFARGIGEIFVFLFRVCMCCGENVISVCEVQFFAFLL